ncbi:MAG: glutamate--tRNA ligase family protein [Acidimicrobiales bacterium]
MVEAGPPMRCRFAPSPTGYLHVGSARTALFNWLFARHSGAAFVLRIEDTDASRNQPELVTNIVDSLRWLGLDWDEGPFFQSERAARHDEVIEQLLAAGRAYVDDGAVRLRVAGEGTIGWHDVVRGPVSFDRANIEDFVIRRSDGSALFLLTNVVDDVDMGITHVIRGEDMINNMPKQLLLLEAMGIERDVQYAHLPLLVDEQRRKLSKRFGDVAIERYRDRGFVAPALRNYLATLGWGSADGVEIRPIEEIVARFELSQVNSSSAFFDVAKLTHFNHEYIRAMDPAAFLAAAEPFADGLDLGSLPAGYLADIQSRTKVLAELPEAVGWLFGDEVAIDEDSWAKGVTKTAAAADILDGTIEAFEACPWDASTLHATLTAVGERHGLKLGKAQAPVRVAVTGRSVGPPLFEGLEVLGRPRTLARLRAARARL